MKVNVPSRSFFCKGGPYHNKLIELTNGQRTLAFSVDGCKPGHYRTATAEDNPIELCAPGKGKPAYDMVWTEETNG